jgi:dTDP-D-glucose 4,6-dehydratase
MLSNTAMPPKRRRFLVTGGAGFIGSAVVRYLIGSTPHEVVVVDKLTYAGNLELLAPLAGDARFRFVLADIADRPRMRELVAASQTDVIMQAEFLGKTDYGTALAALAHECLPLGRSS